MMWRPTWDLAPKMNKLLLAAVCGAIAAIALVWHCGPLICIGVTPVGASLLTLLVAATAENEGDADPSLHDISVFTAVDRT